MISPSVDDRLPFGRLREAWWLVKPRLHSYPDRVGQILNECNGLIATTDEHPRVSRGYDGRHECQWMFLRKAKKYEQSTCAEGL